MSGHTPGPWILMDGRTFDTPSGKFFLSYGSVPGTGEWLFKSPTELDRNAVLIAAAPELLAAAENVIREWEKGELEPAEIRYLQRAVNKAKGEG